MKPVRSTLFFTAVLGLLLAISLLVPEQGVHVKGNWKLKFASVEDLLSSDTLNKKAYVQRLLARSTVTEDPEFQPEAWKNIEETGEGDPGEDNPVIGDPVTIEPGEGDPEKGTGGNSRSVKGDPGEGYPWHGDPGEGYPWEGDPGEGNPLKRGPGQDNPLKRDPGEGDPGEDNPGEVVADARPWVLPANRDSLLRSVYPVSFPGNRREMLYPFFDKLAGLRDGSLPRTRILHFGDSQIENDRMTALIRFRLQWHFGGTGTGLVPAVPIYSGHLAYEKEEYGDWMRYTFFGKRDTSIRHRNYGVMSAFASVPGARYGDWPMLHYRFNTARQTGRFDRVRIFMHSFTDDARVAFQVNDSISDTLININDGFSVAEYTPGVPVKDLKISVGLPEGGRIYGISFETDRGIQVDNIAMRGSAGLTFSRMDRDLLEEMIGELSPGLILLQFGGNVVPYLDAGYYRKALRRELAFFREICPGIPIILIGPADMSTKERGMFVSYPTIEPIRDALKDAALESGCGFWDLYQAMGGRNSMPGFVEADPPLAISDYIHFTPLGANLVAEIFYNSLMVEFNHYLSQHSQP